MRLTCPNCGAQYEIADDAIPEGGRDVQCSNCLHAWFEERPAQSDAPGPEAVSVRSEPTEVEEEEDASADQAEDGRAPADSAALTREQDRAEPPGSAASERVADPAGASQGPAPSSAPGHGSGSTSYDDDGDNSPDGVTLDPARLAVARVRALDPAVAEVLRQEAERERNRRAREAPPLESQPDLGLVPPAPAERTATTPPRAESAPVPAPPRAEAMETPGATGAPESQSAPSRHRAPEPELSDTAAPLRPAAEAPQTRPDSSPTPKGPERRELLPDVEEINKTLRSASERRRTPPPKGPILKPQPRSRFGLGFLLVILVAVVLAAHYIYAPRIARAVPDAAPALDAFVTTVDGARLWLEAQASGLRALFTEGG